MRATTRLLVAAFAAAGLAVAVPAGAAGGHGGTHNGGGHWSGGHGGGGHWNGGHGGGHWSGGGHRHGGHYYGGHRSHWYGPSWSFYWGVPLAVGAWWWGYPYYSTYPGYSGYPGYYTYPYYEGYAYPPAYAENPVVPPATTEVQPGPGAPTQGPLYMNYCESAKAYYPKVTQCPEGWKFIAPAR